MTNIWMLAAQQTSISNHAQRTGSLLILLLVVLAGATLASAAFCQSLPNLAQEARERKTGETELAKVYTNDDLASAVWPDTSTSVAAPAVKAKAEAQSHPLSINGTFYSGFYSAFTRGGGNGSQSIQFVPAGATWDVNGFYMTPDLLDYWVQPELNAGPQASDAGFQGGNGVRMRVSLLRRSLFPVTFRYSNVQLEDVYFGSLSQLSSYTLTNRNKDLGIATELKGPGLPTATIDWGTGSVASQSGIATIPDYLSRTRHLSVDGKYVRWGWDLQGFAHHQRQTSDLFTLGEGTNSSSLGQKVRQYQLSARRSLWDSELYLDGGTQATTTLLLNQPIDLTSRYASANLRLFQRSKWRTSLRAGYTSNVAALLLTRLVGGLDSSGSVAPDSSVLLPLRHTVSSLNLNALTSVDLWHGLGLYGSADRTSVLRASDGGPASNYLTTSGGMTYAGNFPWGNLSAQYGREFGIGSVTGQTGRITGRNYLLGVQHGTRDGLQFDASIHGTDQSVRNVRPADDHSLSVDASLGRRLIGPLSGRLGGGWQQNTFTNAGSEFHTTGYTAHAGIEHPRFQLSGSLISSVGNSLQAYSQQFGGIGVESELLTPLHLIPSDMRGTTFTLHANPFRKLELSALWTRSLQHLEGVVANEFEVIDVHATYHFRRLQFEVGYFRSYQIFTSYLATYPATERGRFYFRVLRPAKIL